MSKKPKHFVAENAELMVEWDFEKNTELGLDPLHIGVGSHMKAWWKCSAGHSWYAMVSNRTDHDRACPYCAHQLPIQGETDLATLFPDLAKQWHPLKNNCSPSEVMKKKKKKAWWICSEGHEWEAEIKSRTTGVGCPYCCGKRVLKGFNDLATVNPDLAAEWHPTKNGDLTPEDVTDASGKKVWWLCKNGHDYEMAVYNRKRGSGCPKCSDALRTSFPEQAIFYYIKQEFPDAVNGYKDIFDSSMELDIFIPSLKAGIEYDGRVFHSSTSNQLRDGRKYAICKEHGIVLIRIREMMRYTPLTLCDHKIEIPNASDKYLNWAINNLCYHLGRIVLPDVRRDRKLIQQYLDKRNYSLAEEYPEIAEEWDYDKNDPLIPENFAPHSNDKVGWICKKCGYKWNAAIGDRTRPDSTGCPACARKRMTQKNTATRIRKKGSFAECYPELLTEWDYDKNTDLSPYEISPGSGKKAWWKCKTCAFEWYGSISHRVQGRGCPYCNHRIVIAGKNDLATLQPELIKEWDYSKNTLNPTEVSIGCGKKAYWKCGICGHEWEASIASRTAGHGCPNWRKHSGTKVPNPL